MQRKIFNHGRMKEKKRTNNSKNPYFAWLRREKNGCVVCGTPGEIHHIDIGMGSGDDTRVTMLCIDHHSAQSNDGLHKDPKEWYRRFYSWEDLEAEAIHNHISYL